MTEAEREAALRQHQKRQAARDEIEAAAREFLPAVEKLLDWINANNFAWDHADSRRDDFAALSAALERMQSALGVS